MEQQSQQEVNNGGKEYTTILDYDTTIYNYYLNMYKLWQIDDT